MLFVIKKNVGKWIEYIHTAKKSITATKYLRKMKEKLPKEKLRIGFIVQVPEVWDKEKDVFNELVKRENVEVVMFVVPPYDFVSEKVKTEYDDNYFVKKYSDALKAINENGKVVDIKELNLDYVFYQRPYDHYLPKELRSCELVKTMKCCYIPYGFAGADVFNAGNINAAFFSNCYFAFLESKYMQNLLYKKFKRTCNKNYQHFEYLGYPCLETYLDMKPNDSIKKALWTPRWSYDQRIGGSQFLEYKDFMANFNQKFSDVELVFRPHPLMFEEFIKKNLMTKNAVETYKKTLQKNHIQYDCGKPIQEIVEETDLFITDYSSIIIQIFLTGKPIIYCESSIELNEIYKKLKEGMYVVHSQEELEYYIKEILKGNDYLKEKRKEIVKDLMLDCRGADKRIVDRIIEDYFEK